MPKVSVIIPVYNEETFLDQCLDSVVSQTLSEIEIICVDDCSTDETPFILKEYAKRDGRIKIITNETNLNAGGSRNQGLKIAKGDYIHFLDADDYMVLDAYEVMYRKAKCNNLDWIKAKAYSIDAQTSKITTTPYYSLSVLDKHEFKLSTNFYKSPGKFTRINVTPWSGIYKRVFLEKNNIVFNSLRCVNDRSFYNNIMIDACFVMFLDHYIIYHRINNPNSLVRIRANNFGCHFESYNMIKEQCAHLPNELLYYILESEIQDIFVWYKRFMKEGNLARNVCEQIKEFLRNIDTSPFGNKLQYCRWYNDYYKMIYHRHPPLNISQLIKKTLRFLKAYGFWSTCKRVVEKTFMGLMGQ